MTGNRTTILEWRGRWPALAALVAGYLGGIVGYCVGGSWIAGTGIGVLTVLLTLIPLTLARRGRWLPALGVAGLLAGALGGLAGYGISQTDVSVYVGLVSGAVLGSTAVICRRSLSRFARWGVWFPWWLCLWTLARIDPTVNSYARIPWWFAVGGFFLTWLPIPYGFPFHQPLHGLLQTFLWLVAVVLTTGVCVCGAIWWHLLARMVYGRIWKDQGQGLLVEDED